MPTTLAPVDFAHNIWFVQNRTNAAGAAVDDADGEALRKLAGIFASGGAVTPNAFKSTLTTGMSFTVGSGTAKKDLIVVPGTASGSPQPYLVSLDAANVTVTLPASSGSGLRRDELYVVVPDPAYPTATVALPRLIVRQGDLGGAAPGPDVGWRNYQVAGQYFVGQNATAPIIEQGAAGATPARLQTQIMALHAAGHGIGGVDSVATLLPRTDTVSVLIPQFAPDFANTMEDSLQKTVTLPAALAGQNIRVEATAFSTFVQNAGVPNAAGQNVRLQCVVAADTGAAVQQTSTSISGGTEVFIAAEHGKDLDGVSAFTVRVRGQCGYAFGGDFTQIVVKCRVTCPRPVGGNAYTVT